MRTRRLALLSTIGMALSAGAAYACTPAGGFGASGASELSAFEPLEIDSSWFRGRGAPEQEPLALMTTAVAIAGPAGTVAPTASPAATVLPTIAKAPRPPRREGWSPFATPKKEPSFSSIRPPAPPQVVQVQQASPMPQMPQAANIPRPAPTSTARPVSTGGLF